MNSEGEGPDESGEGEAHRRRLPIRLPHASDAGRDEEGHERIGARLAQQWSQLREERRAEPEPVTAGPSNFSRAQVPWGVDLAAAWGWRFLVIVAAGFVIIKVIAFFSVVVIPLVVALLIAALVTPVVDFLHHRVGLPRGLSSLLVVIAGIGVVAALLTFAGQQVANGANELADQTVQGLDEVKRWLRDGPLNASDSQINDYIDRAQKAITPDANTSILSRVTEVGTALGHVLAGFFIILFSTYFFLADGTRIWAWIVRLAPRASREHVDSSGRVAWISLTQFVRATVIVAGTDALGIMTVAAILQVPFVLAIGVLVFLGAFVPLIGATVAGTVAILVALVDQGPYVALFMLGGVILIQQIEGHVLQPFLMGRWVSLHPLGVIVAIACGALVAGVAGALVAVPLAAAVNAVVQHLANFTAPGDDPVVELEEDYHELGDEPPTEEALERE